MKKAADIELDFKVDKLTNSIENALTVEIFETEITRITPTESKIIKRIDREFDWYTILKDSTNQLYKLTTIYNDSIIHGLISIIDKRDHIFISLIESAKFNKGKNKIYRGVAGNLGAYACKLSFESGYVGIVSFISKSKLIEHYQISLGAKIFGSGNRMYIDTREALILTNHYFNNINYGKH